MYKKTLNYIKEHRMLGPGDRVIVALSGGADSVCLFHLLHEMKEELNIELEAVHVHHGLRGAEADRDSAYAQELSEGLGVPFVCVHVDAARYAAEHGMSVEEAGRHLRYEILEKERIRFHGTKIAVAHHEDDQAETILFHLFRGTGLKGLGGIRPVRDFIIRPLLSSDRREILAWLEEKGISYCEDSTNASTDYMRNRLRHELLPLIKTQVNEKAVENITHAGEMAAQADAYFERLAERILLQAGKWPADERSYGIPVEALLGEEDIVQLYVVKRMIANLCGRAKDLTSVHIKGVVSLLHKPVGRRADLPYSLYAVKTYGELWIKLRENESVVEETDENLMPIPVFTSFPYEKGDEIPKNGYTKWFDYDKINSALSVRYRQTGDYMTLADGGKKTIKAFMIDEKIPKEIRDRILLVAEGSHVLWVIGYRISEYYKITDNTHTVLQIQINGGKSDGR